MPKIANRIIDGDIVETIDLDENEKIMLHTIHEIKEMADRGELYCPVCGAKYNTFTRKGILYFGASYKDFKHKSDCTEYTTKKVELTNNTLLNLNEWFIQMMDEVEIGNENTESHKNRRRVEHCVRRGVASLNLNNVHKLVNYILENPDFINEKINESTSIKDLFVIDKQQFKTFLENEFNYPFIIVFHKGQSCLMSTYGKSYTKMKLVINKNDDKKFTLYFDEKDFDFSSEFPNEGSIHGYALIQPRKVRDVSSDRCVITICPGDWKKGVDSDIKEMVRQLRKIIAN